MIDLRICVPLSHFEDVPDALLSDAPVAIARDNLKKYTRETCERCHCLSKLIQQPGEKCSTRTEVFYDHISCAMPLIRRVAGI
jgi:hypothetical protein